MKELCVNNKENQLQKTLSSTEDMSNIDDELLEEVTGGGSWNCCGLLRPKSAKTHNVPDFLTQASHSGPAQSLKDLGPRDRLRGEVPPSRFLVPKKVFPSEAS